MRGNEWSLNRPDGPKALVNWPTGKLARCREFGSDLLASLPVASWPICRDWPLPLCPTRRRPASTPTHLLLILASYQWPVSRSLETSPPPTTHPSLPCSPAPAFSLVPSVAFRHDESDVRISHWLRAMPFRC